MAEIEATLGSTKAQIALAKTRDTDKAPYWADDATILPPNAQPTTGKQAIRGYAAGAFASPDFSSHGTLTR